MESQKLYINVPVCLIRYLYMDKMWAVERMLTYGLFSFSRSFQVKKTDAVRTALYDNYHRKEDLPEELAEFLEEKEEEGVISEDYGGIFGAGGEVDIDAIADIECELGGEKDALFLSYGAYRNAVDVANASFVCLPFDEANRFFEELTPATPFFSISVDALKEARWMKYEDLFRFGLYCGIRSIVGKKDMTITNRPMILARAMGCNTPREMEELRKNKKFSTLIDEVTSRRKYEKRMDTLEFKGYISKLHIPGQRYINISTKTLTELEEAIKRQRGENIKEYLRREHDEALARIRDDFNICTS